MQCRTLPNTAQPRSSLAPSRVLPGIALHCHAQPNRSTIHALPRHALPSRVMPHRVTFLALAKPGIVKP